jgi:hypothetical protein
VKSFNLLRLRAGSLGLALAVTLAMNVATAPEARSEGLAGSWSGGGIVTYASGQRERARCRAQYSDGGSFVSVSATCATPSGSVSQSANLRRVGANSYAGSFFNPEYNTTGSIRVTVRGNSQSVSLRSSNGSADLSLRH